MSRWSNFTQRCRRRRKIIGYAVIALGYRLSGTEQTHLGYTVDQVCSRAMRGGGIDDWEWLQEWWNSIEENSETHHNFILWMHSGPEY